LRLGVLIGLVLLSLLALVTMSYFTPLWALWGAGVLDGLSLPGSERTPSEPASAGHITGHRHAAGQPAPHDSGPEDNE